MNVWATTLDAANAAVRRKRRAMVVCTGEEILVIKWWLREERSTLSVKTVVRKGRCLVVRNG